MNEPTYTLRIDGQVVYTGLTAREADALARTAGSFPNSDPAIQSGIRVDVEKEVS